MAPNHAGVSEKIDGQFARAVSLLENAPLSSEQVHELRTTCKRLRGLLRLYRKADKTRLRTMADTIREVASAFSSTRDNDVLQAQLAHWLKARKHAPMRERLQARLAQTNGGKPLPKLTVLRKKMLQTYQEWQALSDLLLTANLDEALLRSRLKAKKAGKKALKSLAPDDLHDWRKRIKDQYYQWDAIAATRAQLRRRLQLKKLGNLLGDVHDLDVFVEFLAHDKKYSECDVVLQRIQRQRERLLSRIEALTAMLQMDVPK